MADPQQALARSVPSTTSFERWSLWRRVFFRFAFVYLVLYCWPEAGRSNLFDAIPGYGAGAGNDDDSLVLTKLAEAPWHALCPWVAVHVFDLKGGVTKYHSTGSGDTTLDYVLVFCFAAIAIIAAAVWSLLDRRRPNYRTLYAWLRVLVRFTLAFTMLSYGFAKLYPLQFMPPFLTRLTETFGESSPMGLLWTFMGASTAYTKFCGLAEVLAGLLLLFRRTTALGALVAAAAIGNVAMLNFCYDVPVKLYSTHLVVMSVFLLIPDLGAMLRFFWLHQPSRLVGVWPPTFERRWLRRSAIAVHALVIASVLFNNVWGDYKSSREFSRTFMKHAPLYGIWNVDRFTVGGSTPDAANWRQLTIEFVGRLSVRDNRAERIYYRTKYDESKHTLNLTAERPKQSGDFTYVQPDSEHLELRGSLNGISVTAEFHRLDISRLLLTNRGFHWISEDPFNR